MSRPHILVADDDPLTYDLIARVVALAAPHAFVTTVTDGPALLAATTQQPADLIILDALLSDLHGLDLVRALRAEGDVTPIILLSINPDAARGRGAATVFMAKPFRVADLRATIAVLLAPEVRPPSSGGGEGTP